MLPVFLRGMENVDSSVTESEMRILREEIKNKYNEYYLLDKDKFPDFEYNSNRANYQPLKDSFEEEFFVVRGLDRIQNNIHIPSTNTLALIFSDDSYVPGKKILNTCRSYAVGKAKPVVHTVVSATSQPKTVLPTRTGSLFLIGLILLAGIAIYATTTKQQAILPASGLSIDRPAHGKVVPRELLITGKVANASTVWIVVRAIGGIKYWVQPPISVEDDGTWSGPVYIGSNYKGDIGIRSQIRAFVNPNKALTDGEILYAWPDAEVSSSIVEVVRGPAPE